MRVVAVVMYILKRVCSFDMCFGGKSTCVFVEKDGKIKVLYFSFRYCVFELDGRVELVETVEEGVKFMYRM